MRNELRALSEWRRRELERARAGGGVRLFWFYMSLGLVWGLIMFGFTLVVDFHHRRAFDAEDLQTRALGCFVGGLLLGLGTWAVREAPGAGRAHGGR